MKKENGKRSCSSLFAAQIIRANPAFIAAILNLIPCVPRAVGSGNGTVAHSAAIGNGIIQNSYSFPRVDGPDYPRVCGRLGVKVCVDHNCIAGCISGGCLNSIG